MHCKSVTQAIVTLNNDLLSPRVAQAACDGAHWVRCRQTTPVMPKYLTRPRSKPVQSDIMCHS